MQLEEARAILELTLAEYAAVRTAYHNAVYNAVQDYLTSDNHITAYKADFQEAIGIAYDVTAGIAWKDGNGSMSEAAAIVALLAAWIEKEQGHAADLFERLRVLRTSFRDEATAESQMIAIREADARAAGYSRSLDYFYALIKLTALKDEELQFGGMSGNESCPECTKLYGTWHKASWYIARGYVPPRGENLSCAEGGHCEHVLTNRKGELVTI